MGGGHPIILGDLSGPRTKNPAKQAEFQQLFNLPGEEVVEDYTCAYQGDAILYHGRMYMTHQSVCFHSQIFKKTLKIIPFDDIVDISKKNTAIVFPNAIEFTTTKRKFTFASFMYRDHAYKLATDLWNENRRGGKGRSTEELTDTFTTAEGSPASDSPLLDAPENPIVHEGDSVQQHLGDYSGEGIVADTDAGVLADASSSVSAAAGFLWRHTTPVLQSAVSLFADGDQEGEAISDESQLDQTKMRVNENRPAPKSPLPQADGESSTITTIKEISPSSSPPKHPPQQLHVQPQTQPLLQSQPHLQPQLPLHSQPQPQASQLDSVKTDLPKSGSKRASGLPEPGYLPPKPVTQALSASMAAQPTSQPSLSATPAQLSQSSPIVTGSTVPPPTTVTPPAKPDPPRKKTPLAPLGQNCTHIGEMKKDSVVLDIKLEMNILAFYYNFIAEERSDAFWHSLNQELGYLTGNLFLV
eukprot:TRINITY_DN2604_c0_g1_i2.p1 TRINITY_DN2604_c0_g1~~TRINITY_DN2604_c0_g1_i2.p1  ORF type:complete len:514 (+),score=69.94 TRINITY_DN2604_c0_g1_i2:134-1543(+)